MSDSKARARARLLFATPVVIGEFDDAEPLNAALEQRILAKREEDQGLKLSNRGGWQSTHDFVRWSGEAGRTIINRACELANGQVTRADGAAPAGRSTPGPTSAAPARSTCRTSTAAPFGLPSITCAWARGKAGQLVLHDPRMPGLRMHAPGVRFSNAGPELRADIKPKAGLIVLFPGWLSHSVEPWLGVGEQISVAMNIRAAG